MISWLSHLVYLLKKIKMKMTLFSAARVLTALHNLSPFSTILQLHAYSKNIYQYL